MEPELLPPWTKKRRLTTLGLLTGFILLASSFIGIGLYQIGVERGWVKRPFSKQQIAQELMNDADFIRAIQKSATKKHCVNTKLGFEYDYQSPLAQVNPEGDQACTTLVTLHSTGADVIINIEVLDQAREVFVAETVKQFEQIDTQMMTGTHYPTSRLSGIRQGVASEMYVIGLDRQKSFLISYAPTDPTVTGKVIALVESFYSMPQ